MLSFYFHEKRLNAIGKMPGKFKNIKMLYTVYNVLVHLKCRMCNR